MKPINLTQLHQSYQVSDPNRLLLDVRTPKEFYDGHIPGARNIPFDQVMNYVSELKKYNEVLVYCKMGGRAHTACEILSSLGIQNLSYLAESGFPNWQANGLPVE